METPKVEQTLDVSIEKLVYGGEGLARTPEGVLLVPSVIPGERAQVLPEPLRRGVRRGQLVQVSEASADRVAAECPYFGRCGGCQHQHIAYARQLQLKQEILRECFERIGKLRLA
ncbi:MAG TPA: TRAM domain-containing protein, partial [Terriglobia bacterium]